MRKIETYVGFDPFHQRWTVRVIGGRIDAVLCDCDCEQQAMLVELLVMACVPNSTVELYKTAGAAIVSLVKEGSE